MDGEPLMSRKVISVLTTIVVLTCIVVGSAIMWPNIASSTGGQASATIPAARQVSSAALTGTDFNRIFASVTAVPLPRLNGPALDRPDFDRVFASVASPSRENTPPNRERLRNVGWKRILGPA
jgi:hypothetical protein